MTTPISPRALRCYDSYYLQRRFTHWEDGSRTDGVAFGVILGDVQEICFEGSHNARDWWRNFNFLPLAHPTLGIIDAGLYAGVPAALTAIKGYLDKSKPVEIDGHSRGGSNAVYTGAELILDGYQVSVRALNPPKTQGFGSQVLSGIYAGRDIIITRVDGDPVSLEPPAYSHPVEPLVRPVAPVSMDELEMDMKYHHVHLCILGEILAERANA